MSEKKNPNAQRLQSAVKIEIHPAAGIQTLDQALWSAIRNRTDAIQFDPYSKFISRLLCNDSDDGLRTGSPPSDKKDGAKVNANAIGSPSIDERRTELGGRPNIYGVDSYQLLKLATEAFLIFESGIVIKGKRNEESGEYPDAFDVKDEELRHGESVTQEGLESTLAAYLRGSGGSLPYLRRIVGALLEGKEKERVLPYCQGILRNRLSCPSMLELIWSYWHEEGMLVQAMNAIALRFQNRRRGTQDPLANLELDPLRPLNHLLWGFIQDEQNRLTVARRAYEYDHHYGISLYGKAVSNFEPADSRSKFIQAFHHLLYRAAIYYQEVADTQVIPDGFSLLNALKEVHLILSEGMHNQFGDLPWTARAEMLMMQWLIARPEMREFLRGRYMVPYTEPWMGSVDAMKRLQGWTDVSISQFRDLGVFGEQIVLSIRYGDWSRVNDQEHAKNWAKYWRPEIQSYIHSYLATTGVDLIAENTDARRAEERNLQPSVHLRNRLAEQRSRAALPAPTVEVVTAESVTARAIPGVRRPLLPGK